MELSKALDFLRRLGENNNREWFQENRERYDGAREQFLQLVGNLIPVVRNIDPSIGVPEAGECVFRIFRDVRFSKDKSPYKTNFGAFFARGGRKSPYAGYYLHLEPGGSFVGGGAYMPEPARLKAIRTSIYRDPDEYKSIAHSPDFRSCFGEVFGEKLKRPPKGFPVDFPDIDLLKNKHYAVTRAVSDDFWAGERFMEEIERTYVILFPFNRFLNRAIEDSEAE